MTQARRRLARLPAGMALISVFLHPWPAAHAQSFQTAAAGTAKAGPDVSLGGSAAIPLDNAGAAAPASEVPNAAFPATAPAASSPNAASDPYANYRWKGININLPPPTNTIDPDLFGYRQKLADDYGIGYIGDAQVTYYDNVLRHDHHGTQVYAGQKPTVLGQNFLAVTIDLSRYGIPEGQIVVTGVYDTASWNALSPTTFTVGALSYYQSLFNKHLDIKAGLLAENFEYVGTFTGGSISGGVFGPSGSLLAETGGSTSAVPNYGINLTGHITRYYYDKLGVARGVNPGGVVLEHNYNPVGLRFSTPNSGAWVIDELGYLRPSKTDVMQTWVRAGGVYSGGHYAEIDHPQYTSDHNYFLYLLADRQILQVSSKPRQAYRGLYVGFSVEHVPPNLNRFSQYYEARIYGLGLLPHRPFDQVSLVATENVFSNFAYEQAEAAHHLAHADSKAITGSYSFNVVRGVYLSVALNYTNSPTPLAYTGSTGSALNAIAGAAVFY